MARLPSVRYAGASARSASPAKSIAAIALSREAELPSQWGRLPALSTVAALGLISISAADRLSSVGYQGLDPLFWLGLLAIVAPASARLIAPRVARFERLGLVIVVGLDLYLVKLLQSPFAFTYADEFVHLFNANQIFQTGRLFGENSILPATAFYPGLESATAAIMHVAGLDGFGAGVVVIGMARLVMMLALFLLYEQLSGSARVASLGSLLYAANANFLFWSVQFSYESLALPLAVLVLYAVARREAGRQPVERVALTLVAVILTCTVIVSHHIASYFLAGTLLLLVVASWLARLAISSQARKELAQLADSRPGSRLASVIWRLAGRPAWPVPGRGAVTGGPGGLATFALVAALVWLIYVASFTIHYLSPVFISALLSLARTIRGEETGRVLFQSNSGVVAPIGERIIGLSSVLLCALGLPFGLRQFWRRYLYHPFAIVLAAGAVAYFGVLGLRLIPAAWEIANRSSEFLFIGLAFILAMSRQLDWLQGRVWLRPLLVMAIVVIFAGGVIAGWQPQLRLAQVYQVTVGNQRYEPAGAATARWTLATLGPAHRFATDEANGRFLLTYGQQKVLAGRDHSIKSIFESAKPLDWQYQVLQDAQIEYIGVDRRLRSSDNMTGYFFDRGSMWPLPSDELLPPENYTKFEQLPGVSRIFDAGDLVLYDVRIWVNGTKKP